MQAIALRALPAATAASTSIADGARTQHSTHAHSARIPPRTQRTTMAMMICTCCSTARRISALFLILHTIAVRTPDCAMCDGTRREETLPMACRNSCPAAAPLHTTREKSPPRAPFLPPCFCACSRPIWTCLMIVIAIYATALISPPRTATRPPAQPRRPRA